MNEKVLCYVSGCFAYFTDVPLSEEWGDDWDDAPYEHNAGSPMRGNIKKYAFSGNFYQPCDGVSNSRYSVEMINNGAVPWLVTESWMDKNVSINAGVTESEFIRLINLAGGTVYEEIVYPATAENG